MTDSATVQQADLHWYVKCPTCKAEAEGVIESAGGTEEEPSHRAAWDTIDAWKEEHNGTHRDRGKTFRAYEWVERIKRVWPSPSE